MCLVMEMKVVNVNVGALVKLGSTQTARWRGRKRIGLRPAWDLCLFAQSFAKLFQSEACEHRCLQVRTD